MRVRFAWVYLVAVFVLIACGGKGASSAPFKGEIPVVVVNKTGETIINARIKQGYEGKEYNFLEGSPAIAPGARAQFALAAGKYSLTLSTPAKPGKYESENHALYLYELVVAGPTELVVFDGDVAPNDPPAAGMKHIAARSVASQIKQHDDDKKAAVSSRHSRCTKEVPPKNETPAPGATKADGKWRCVLGGSYQGADNVNLVQLADGRIQGTLTGTDMNTKWEGAVVGDEVHFRFEGTDLSGGRLKLDPGGRAMSGKAWTFADDMCMDWTLTCNKT